MCEDCVRKDGHAAASGGGGSLASPPGSRSRPRSGRSDRAVNTVGIQDTGPLTDYAVGRNNAGPGSGPGLAGLRGQGQAGFGVRRNPAATQDLGRAQPIDLRRDLGTS